MTLREIAELAGVSPSAVSRYLNGGSLSAAKYEAIDKVIKETGYVPNQVAHDLRTGRVRQVGILVPKIHSKSVSQVVEGAHEVLAKAGYMTVLGSLEHAPSRVAQYLEWMQAYHGRRHRHGGERRGRAQRHLQNCGIPLVVTGQHFKDYNCVYHDDWGAAKDLTNLRQAGPHRIGCMSRRRRPGRRHQPHEGVKAALWEAGFTPAPPPSPRTSTASGYEAMKQLLADRPDIDGVFCATDSMWPGRDDGAEGSRQKVPEDVSVVAFGNDWANPVSTRS